MIQSRTKQEYTLEMIVDSYAHYVKEVGHHFHGNCSHGDIGYEFSGNINIERVLLCPLLGVVLE